MIVHKSLIFSDFGKKLADFSLCFCTLKSRKISLIKTESLSIRSLSKESLSIRLLDVPSNLDECLLCELSYKNKKCFIATLYRSPSQSREEFEKFLTNFEVLIKAISNQKDAISIIMGDYEQ